MRDEIVNFCSRIGPNPLHVQGAGGNISWKQEETLYVKASGTRLDQAGEHDIFVPVDNKLLQKSIQKKQFAVTPTTLHSCPMKPSIETMLHALMPHPVVVHLHPIEPLACLVRKHCPIEKMAKPHFSFAMVDYRKPGAPLAAALHEKIHNRPDIDVVFLKNHGVIIGGKNPDELLKLLKKIDDVFQQELRPPIAIPPLSPIDNGYRPIPCQNIQQLVFDPALFKRLPSDWALYPDHLVFLGPEPYFHIPSHDIVFLENKGVYSKTSPISAQYEQLLCYYHVLSRQSPEEELVSLSSEQITEIVNWDAEHYRQSLSRDPHSDKP